MTTRRWLGVAVGLALVTAACTGGTGNSIDDLVPYFEQVEQITVDLDERNQGLAQTTDIASARAFFSALNPSSEIALDEFSALAPPEAARESHDRLVELSGRYLALNKRIAERLEAIETSDEFNALASDAELGIQPQNALSARVETACRDLQAVASGEGIDVSLDCNPG